jgi:hypothetical protein
VISITHRLTSITDYDRIFVIADGQLVEQGTHDELVAEGGTYAHLWAEQAGAPVPERAPFDAPAALASIVLFRDLDKAALEEVASRLRAFTLDPGETLAEREGRLVLVVRGRGEVLSPSLAGELVPTAEVRGGDAFGVHALLGEETGTSLRAVKPLELLELDTVALGAIAAEHEEVAAVFEGSQEESAAPAGGHRLGRATFATRAAQAPTIARPTGATEAGPDEVEIRKATGAFPRVDA